MEITLWDQEIPNDNPRWDTPNSMTFYPVETIEPLPAVVIFPGGGYTHRAEHEAEPIARFFNEKGFQAFVVNYRVYPHQFPCGLQDAQRAVKLVRGRAKEYGVNPEAVFTVGFSAGGHLTGCVATLPDYAKVGDAFDDISPKPTGAVLSYPVVSAEVLDGINSCQYIEKICESGEISSQELSLEKRVTEKTAPCFVWHTFGDVLVSVSNSLLFCRALKAHNVPFELHTYSHGPHGLGLAQKYPDISQWAEHAVRWMKSF